MVVSPEMEKPGLSVWVRVEVNWIFTKTSKTTNKTNYIAKYFTYLFKFVIK